MTKWQLAPERRRATVEEMERAGLRLTPEQKVVAAARKWAEDEAFARRNSISIGFLPTMSGDYLAACEQEMKSLRAFKAAARELLK